MSYLPGEPDTQRLQDLAKDLKDLYKDLKKLTKDKGLIIALGFNLSEDQKDLNSNLNKDLNKLAKDEELIIGKLDLIIGLAFVLIDFSEN